MKISKVTSWIMRVPYRFPLHTKDKYTEANMVKIETDEGIDGYAISIIPMRAGIRAFINGEAAATITGLDPLRTEHVRNELLRMTASKYFSGIWNSAASLIDIAVWDIKGKALGQPIWKILGGANTELPVYVSFGLPSYSIDELIEAASLLIRDGHKRLKIMVGGYGEGSYQGFAGIDVAWEANRLLALREAVGPDIELMIDGNMRLSLAQAVRLAKLCERVNLTWFEDPVLKSDPRLLARLRQQTGIPVAVGSTGTSDLLLLREYLIHESVDYLQPNVRDIGGYTQAVKAVGLAQAFNMPLGMGGQFPHLNLHMLGATPNGGRIEFHYESWGAVEALFDGGVSPEDGKITLPETPGLGLTPRPQFLDFAVS